ncbi:MAG: Plug and carboxypeptidase regulatory-like domain-containing protein [Acidobacteria bacterium]|nr:Plug and carboxypeptidase regulatory-like domain-containing protein [Acidobacteriota bacterium]
MRFESFFRRAIPLALLTLIFGVTAFGQTSASLSGIVQDPQGNAVVGARVIVADPNKNQQVETKTGSDGVFAFPALQPGTYTVTVEAQGFKKFVKGGVVIAVADRQSTGVITLDVGQIGDTVEVTADAAQLLIKTESGEQSQVISGEQIKNLALNGRNFLDLVKLTPGVVSFVNGQTAGPLGTASFNINGTRGTQHNVTLDGITNLDTGSNGAVQVALVPDNIAEFKILTSNYQAEYGRAGGGSVQIVSKSGTKDFHGTGYYFHRHEQFNANGFFNNAEGRRANGTEVRPRNFYRYNYQGYNIGGPVHLPKSLFGPLGGFNRNKDKLFFFWSQDWQEQLIPQAARQSRVPTAAEVKGDFSNTRDGNGNPIFIRDPLKAGACTAADRTACFPDNIIPANRLSPNGVAILSKFASFANNPARLPLFNHESQLSFGYPRREYSIRLDYNVSEKTRAFVRYTRDDEEQVMPYGLGWTGGNNQIPLDNLIFKLTPAWNSVLNVTSTLSPTLTNEFIFGAGMNTVQLNPTNKEAATYAGFGFNFALPYPYPATQFINVNFGGTPLQNFAGSNGYGQFPYLNKNPIFNFFDNISKVWGSHTAKAGIYIERNRKDTPAGGSMSIFFSNNPNNPNNTGHPYANALLGEFDSFSEPTRPIYQVQFRYTNVEWYLQDNWKATQRLTLDYGLRFTWFQPQYDQRKASAFFSPEKYDPAKAVRLYRRAPNGQAFDPATPSALLPSYLIGRIVPGSGDPANGMQEVSKGFLRGGFEDRGIQYGPAFGFAYDVFGNQKTVVRGGYRISYDRVTNNNVILPASALPPVFYNPRFDFGNLNTVGASAGQVALGTSFTFGVDPKGFVPNVQSFSLQVQQDLGFDTVVSAGYVGTLSRHLTEDLNLNAIPYGALFTRGAQDPSRYPGGVVPDEEPNLPQVYRDAGLKFTGQFALPADFLRPYPGYSTIQMKTYGGSSNYHSLQATAQRRFKRGLTLGAAYTWSKALGTASASEGEFINIVCSRCYDYRALSFDRRHALVINYLYDLPKVRSDNWLLKGALNGWQITGITQFLSGLPRELGFGIPNINTAQRVSGSWTEGPRPILTGNAQPSINREAAFDFTKVRMPDINPGPQPRSIIYRPGINVTDLSLFKNIPLGRDSARFIQLRLETFNVFNHAQFDSFNSGLTFNVAGSFADYKANQQGSSTTLRNLRGGVNSPAVGPLGRATAEFNAQPGYVSGNRVVQLAAKIYF